MRIFKLKVDLPFLPKGSIYHFHDESGNIYKEMEKEKRLFEYPLRSALADYLWLLLTEGKRFLLQIKRLGT